MSEFLVCQIKRMETMSEFLINNDNSSAQAREWAKGKSLVVKVPTPTQLFIDIDDDQSLDEWDRNYGIVDAMFGIDEFCITPSRTKPQGKHIVVELERPVTPTERCLCQAILGSDRRRQGHSFDRIRRNDPEPTLFFETEEPCTQTDPTSPTPSPQS